MRFRRPHPAPDIDVDPDIDPLTGLATRRALEISLPALIASGRGGMCAIFDLDGFIYVNDWFGHAMGDEYLKLTAQVVSAFAPADAAVHRIGGDEFAVFGPVDEWSSGLAHCQRIVDSVRFTLRSPGDGSHGADREVTLSCGYVMWPAGRSPDAMDVLRHADMAMYTAKREGRHRLVVATPFD
jgi:diguanylate cyclase (GGDEF)-like protein